jgi:hypothetical protein
MDSASIGYTVVPAPESPKEPDRPPGDAEKPPLRIELSSAERPALRELLRTGKLLVVANVSQAAKLALTGRAKLNVGRARKPSTKFVAVFKEKTINFAAAGEKRVALMLSQRGREALRHLAKVQLAVTGEATDPAGETAARKVMLTLSEGLGPTIDRSLRLAGDSAILGPG